MQVQENTLVRFREDPIGFLRHLAEEGGPIAEFRLARRRMVLLTAPEQIEEVLVTQQRAFRKGPGLLRTCPLLGNGLLTAEGADHRAQRRRMQPAFQKARIDSYTSPILQAAQQCISDWRHGETRDIHREMATLTLQIVTETLFSTISERPKSGPLLDDTSAALHALYRPLSPCPHRQQVAQTTDPVEALRMSASDLLGRQHHAEIIDKQQLDEAVTLLLAGHESVAVGLAWTWYALSRHPAARTRFEEEIDRTGQDALNLEQLPYTQNVVRESLRVFPPAWMFSREATEPVRIGGRAWPNGTIFVLAPVVTHVDKTLWDRPLEFEPDRWETGDRNPTRHRFTYFPFGGGARRCIGERFALNEMALILAAVGRSWRLDPLPGAAEPLPEPLVTLRPRGGMAMVLTERPAHQAIDQQEDSIP